MVLGLARVGSFALVALTLVWCAAPKAAPVAVTSSSQPVSAPVPAASSAAPPAELKPELVSFPSGSLTLGGFIWRPAGAGPFPAVVINHGSEELPGTKAGQAELFVPHGYVVFVPHRRGQGRSKAAGRYIHGYYDPSASESPAFVNELVAQTDDVMAAVSYLGTLPYVDSKRVVMAGCSLGGIESLFAAERGTGIVAAVDFAGASITWAGNRPLRERMKQAAKDAKVPVFFIQAENDYNTAPSKELSALMQSAGKPARIHIFPPHGTTPAEGHGLCGGGSNPEWGPEVLSFFDEALAKH